MAVDRYVDAWGRTIIEPAAVASLLMKGVDISEIFVDGDPAIAEYNKWCRHFDKPGSVLSMPPHIDHSPAEEHARRAAMWFISEDMQQVDVRQFLLSMCETNEQWDRVNMEMDLFEERALIPLLQLMIFLVDHFRHNNVVWGVGRGSSVASYCLFLIGVHKIDPLKYNLDVHDFLK